MSGAFPRIMSQEMPRHNGVVYRMASAETEPFSPHYRGSIHTGSTLPPQSPALPSSLEPPVSGVMMTSSRPAELNSATAATIQTGGVGQKQLPDEVVNIAQALPSRTNAGHCVDTWSSSMTLHSPTFTTHHLSMDTVMTASIGDTCSTVMQQAAQTATVNVTCTKPISSSSVQYLQQYATAVADDKVQSCLEVNSGSGQYSSAKDGIVLNQQSDAVDSTVTASAVKVEPKIEMETDSGEVTESTVSQIPVTEVKVEMKTEQLKHEIKSEVVSEESIDSKDEQIQNAVMKPTDAMAVNKPTCDADLKKESSRKGVY